MAVYIETRGRFRAVAEEYLSPSLLNDYLRMATLSIAMCMVIVLSTVVVHEFYHYSHLLFEALIHASILFAVILPVVGIVVAMASIIAAANKTLLTSVSFVAETAGPSSIIFTLVAAATSYFISRE